MTKRKKPKQPGEGVYLEFHGAYADETKARTKARKVKGWVLKRTLRGKRRFVVAAERAPF